MSAITQPLLGEQLIAHNVLSPGRLEHALHVQKSSGGRLGDILVSEGLIGYFDLYRTLAKRNGFPFADLLKAPPCPALLKIDQAEYYLHLRLIPYRYDNGVMTIALCEATEEALAWIRTHYTMDVRLVMTSPYDIRKTIESQFGKDIEHRCQTALWQTSPLASARETFSASQKQGLIALGIVSLVSIINAPIESILIFIIFCQLCYSFTLLFKCIVFAASAPLRHHDNWEEKLATLSPDTLPVYTVLVPMYKEADSMPGLIAALQALDYPQHKLDIKLVLEADDKETLDAAYALKPSHHFEIIRVPPGPLRTKPKACNYALRFARGEFLTIFDADDQPDPLQLKKAVYTFRHSPPDVACLQAHLNYYNADTNLLTRLFSLEYAILFDFMLPGLQRLGIPIPLGGTSNHIRLRELLTEGEWDPYNVTEDADLGTRFAARGLRTLMLDSVTMEEGPHTIGAWIRQRSRWIKGYMQTWLVYMRRPVTLLTTLGLRGFIGFQFFVGFSTMTYLTAPIIWVLGCLWAEQFLQFHQIHFPAWLLNLCALNMAFNITTLWGFAYLALPSARTFSWRAKGAAAAYPLYMLLHSIASYKSLWQLFFRPHFWEKTTHGLAGIFANNNLKYLINCPSLSEGNPSPQSSS